MFNVKENMAKQSALWAGADWNEVSAYIGPNSASYREAFERHKLSWAQNGRGPGFKLDWHWGAFIPLIGIPWAAARKQWQLVAILIGAIVLINILSLFLPSPTGFGFMAFMIPMMAKGMFVGMAADKVRKVKAELPAGASLSASLAEAGGLNMTYGLIAGAICAALLVLSVLSLVAEG